MNGILQIAQELVTAYNKQTEHVTALLRSAKREGYSSGVRDLMNALTSAAADETLKQELGTQPPQVTE